MSEFLEIAKKVSPLKDSADVSDRSQILIFAHEKVAGKWVHAV